MKPTALSALLFLLSYGCAGPETEHDPTQVAERILDGAARAMGAWPISNSLQLMADASVEGPRGPFRTLIHSSANGRVRMEQAHSGFLAGVGVSGGWMLNRDSSRIDELGGRLGFVISHELHMLALHPRSRLSNPIFQGTVTFDSTEAFAIEMTLPTGNSLVSYYRLADTLPIGHFVPWAEPGVIVTWSDWAEIEGLLLFNSANFQQGEDNYRYDYERIEVRTFPDSTFEAPILF